MAEGAVTVAETPLFIRRAADIWDEAERDAFHILRRDHPVAGEAISETGGVRKIRWGRGSSGKRGGVRVIYYYHDAERPLYFADCQDDRAPRIVRSAALVWITGKLVPRQGTSAARTEGPVPLARQL